LPGDCTSAVRSGPPENIYALWYFRWTLWEIGATGGADAKLIISLVLLFGNGLLFIPIVLVGGFRDYLV
jgi:hypothetical protein